MNEFMWRNGPNTIGRYYPNDSIPSGSEVILSGTEICVVFEDGKVAGSATAKREEINPKMGLLKRIIGTRSPNRSFLFADIGPHNLFLKIEASTSDSDSANGFVVCKVTTNAELAPRMIKMATKGNSLFTAGTLANEVESEANHLIKGELAIVNSSNLKDSIVHDRLCSVIKSGLRTTLNGSGFEIERCWITWNQNEYDELNSMKHKLERLSERNEILTKKQYEEFETSYNLKMQQLELEAKLQIAGEAAEVRAKAELELAAIRGQAEINSIKWDFEKQLRQDIDENRRLTELNQAQHEIEIAKANLERNRLDMVIEEEKKDKEVDRAMNLFEQVQAKKKERMKILHTRALLRAALNGSLNHVESRTENSFGLKIPSKCEGVPDEVLDPRSTWKNKKSYDNQANNLVSRFHDNFAQFESHVSNEVKEAAPRFTA